MINSSDINKYLKSEKYDFKLFDIKYTLPEQKCIDEFILDEKKIYTYVGSLEKLEGVNNFLSSIGNNNKSSINKMEKIIIKLVKKVIKGYQMEHFLSYILILYYVSRRT